jgi:hypothetical protein
MKFHLGWGVFAGILSKPFSVISVLLEEGRPKSQGRREPESQAIQYRRFLIYSRKIPFYFFGGIAERPLESLIRQISKKSKAERRSYGIMCIQK